MPLLAHGDIISYSLGVIGIICVVLIGSSVVYFVVRDAFRFGRKEIPVSWALAIITFFAALGFWAARYVGLLVAPVLGLAYTLGRRRARKDAATRQSQP
jgi:predicted Kef-type K+ transport protein